MHSQKASLNVHQLVNERTVVVYPYNINKMVPGNEKWINDTCNNMDECQKHYFKWRTQEQMTTEFIPFIWRCVTVTFIPQARFPDSMWNTLFLLTWKIPLIIPVQAYTHTKKAYTKIYQSFVSDTTFWKFIEITFFKKKFLISIFPRKCEFLKGKEALSFVFLAFDNDWYMVQSRSLLNNMFSFLYSRFPLRQHFYNEKQWNYD